MPYDYIGNEWVWVGDPAGQPIIGETKAEYEARTGLDPMGEQIIPTGGGVPAVINGGVPVVMENGYQIMGEMVPTHADIVPGLLTTVDHVPVSGPGVPEPPRQMVKKQWSVAVHSNTYGTFRIYFFALFDGRVMCYNPSTKVWNIWRPKKHIILPRGRTTLSQAVKAQRYLDRMWRTVAKRTKALKLA